MDSIWTPEQYRDHFGKQKNAQSTANRLKFGNIHQEVDGIRFDSKKEAEYYGQLKIRKRHGNIKDFQRQVKFSIDVNGVHICDYVCDFIIYFNDGLQMVVDVKSSATESLADFRMKKALMLAVHKIKIQIV